MAESLQRGPRHLPALGQTRLLLGPVVSPPQLGEDRELAAIHAVERFAEVHVRAVQVGQVEEANAAIVGVMHEIDELGEAHAGLIRLPIAAVDAGALAQSRHLDSRLAELDHWRRRGPIGGGRGDWAGCPQRAGSAQRGGPGSSSQESAAVDFVHGGVSSQLRADYDTQV